MHAAHSPALLLPARSRVSEFPAAVTGRRICIAYSSFAEGRGLLCYARDYVLTPHDTVYICHVFSKDQNVVRGLLGWPRWVGGWVGNGSPVEGLLRVAVAVLWACSGWQCPLAVAPPATAHLPLELLLSLPVSPLIPPCFTPKVTKEVMKMARALTLMPQRPDSAGSDEVTRDNSLDFGAAELAGFPNLQLGVALQVGRDGGRRGSREGWQLADVWGRQGGRLPLHAAARGAARVAEAGLVVQQAGLDPTSAATHPSLRLSYSWLSARRP